MQEVTGRSDGLSSAGHRLGQLVGDWWELNVVFPLLSELATSLALFADNRTVERTARGDKLVWPDADGNGVDYDFVIELGGTPSKLGIPVAFVESFWRRGARHSKDKARDDSTKLIPMRETYPTARFLGIAACGEFTEPAKEFVRSRNIELFFVPKEAVVSAFSQCGLDIDYPDSLPEARKASIAAAIESKLNDQVRREVADALGRIVGSASMDAFGSRVRGLISATPMTIEIWEVARSQPRRFSRLRDATEFLHSEPPFFGERRDPCAIEYKATYSDGSTFFRSYETVAAALADHQKLEAVAAHMDRISCRARS